MRSTTALVAARTLSVKALAARDAEDPNLARMLNLSAPQFAEKRAVSRALRVSEARLAAQRLGEAHPFEVVRKIGGALAKCR